MIYFDGEEEREETPQKEAKQSDLFAGKFLKTRQILLSGEINKDLSDKIVQQLFVMEAESSEPVRLYINSPGGDVDAGFAIFDVIRFINAPVTAIGMGLVASAAAIVLLATPKERRFGLPNSRYLIHQPLSGIKGVATEIEIHAREIEKIRSGINELIAEETGRPAEKVAKDTDRDFWMNAEEALEYGLISKVLRSRKDIP